MSVQYDGDNITFADGSTLGSGWTGFKNRIINGAMMIDQRNAGASVSLNGSLAFPLDRFKSFGRVAGGATGQQSSVAPAGFTNSLLYTVTSGATPNSGDYACIQQFVEGFNFADSGYGTANAQPFTLSFWVRSSVTGTYAINIQNNNSSRSYIAQYTINSANTWEQKSVTITGDTGGTWNTTNGSGLVISWDLGFGYGVTSTTNSWLSGDFRRVSSNVQLAATTGATFYITGVQLEKGSTATSFDYRPYGTELALCQRYYFKATNYSLSRAESVTNLYAPVVKMPVTMRTAPTLDSGASFAVSGGSAGTPALQSGSGTTTGTDTSGVYNSSTNWTVGSWVSITAGFTAEL